MGAGSGSGGGSHSVPQARCRAARFTPFLFWGPRSISFGCLNVHIVAVPLFGAVAVRSMMAAVLTRGVRAPRAATERGEVGWSPAEKSLLREALCPHPPLPANKASLFSKHLTNKTELKLVLIS